MKQHLLIIGISVLLMAVFGLSGCMETGIEKDKEMTEKDKEIPQYTIVEEEDLSYSSIIRWQVRATTTDNLTKDEIKSIAEDIVKGIKERMEVNAISIFLYREGDDIHWIYTIASIDYAPYGDWSRAGDVNTGDYSKHTYNIEYA